MTVLFSGPITKAYVEIDPASQSCQRVLVFLGTGSWIELTGVETASGDLLIPSPLGCACTIKDISAKGWETAKYEVEFASSYKREGMFWANEVRVVESI
ncbi:MAG: hypothetical protein JNN20_12440 [Betaproteobacteria bacterium]|nr:hypothetical protein [Betaproteobacteria bacterium]